MLLRISDLRYKNVVNLSDGCCLGVITDAQFDRKKLALMRENKWKAPKIPKGKSFASITIEARFSAR